MKSKPIVVLMGKSSSGKTTILNELVERFGWHNCVSYTTRDMREGEVEGKDYFYLSSNEQFDTMYGSGELFEKTEYLVNGKLWKYGIGKASFVDENVCSLIVNPIGLQQLLDSPLKERLIVFEIGADAEILIQRYWDRSDKSDKAKVQLVDRLLRDIEDFEENKIANIQYMVGFDKYYEILNQEGYWDMDGICDFIRNVVEDNE